MDCNRLGFRHSPTPKKEYIYFRNDYRRIYKNWLREKKLLVPSGMHRRPESFHEEAFHQVRALAQSPNRSKAASSTHGHPVA